MERYTFVQKIAEGAYGTVWKCVDTGTGAVVAVKKLKEPPQTRQDAEFAMREVRLLQQISHLNVVKLIEAYQSASGRLYLVFEYVEATVLQLLKAPGQQQLGLPLTHVQSIIWQVAQALVYLHKNKIIHRDIKPSNILISEGGIVKLCDFGFARPFAMGSDTVAQYTTYVVTRWYRPPEVLVGDTYGPAVDIWALGCIFVELVTGRPLFPGKTQHDQLWLVLKAVGSLTDRQMKVMKLDSQFACFKAPSKAEVVPLEAQLPHFTAPMMELLRACLQPDAAKRATAEQLLALPFFQGVQDVLPPACRSMGPADHLPDDITHKLNSLKAQQQQQQQQHQVQHHMQQAAGAPPAASAVVATVTVPEPAPAGAAAAAAPVAAAAAPAVARQSPSKVAPAAAASPSHAPQHPTPAAAVAAAAGPAHGTQAAGLHAGRAAGAPSPHGPKPRPSDGHAVGLPHVAPESAGQHTGGHHRDLSHAGTATISDSGAAAGPAPASGPLAQQQHGVGPRHSGLPPGLPVPKQPLSSATQKPAVQHRRHLSGGALGDEAGLQEVLARQELTLQASLSGHLPAGIAAAAVTHAVTTPTAATAAAAPAAASGSAGAGAGPGSGVRGFQAAFHHSLAPARAREPGAERERVDAGKRQTWHGEPDGLSSLLPSRTLATVQQQLPGPHQVPAACLHTGAVGVAHGSGGLPKVAPPSSHSSLSSEHPSLGHSSSTLPPRSSKDERRGMRRSNTYAGSRDGGGVIASPTCTGSSTTSHAATPSHHAPACEHDGSSAHVHDACTVMEHMASGDVSRGFPDQDLHGLGAGAGAKLYDLRSPDGGLRSPMGARRAGPADAVGHVRRERGGGKQHVASMGHAAASVVYYEEDEEDVVLQQQAEGLPGHRLSGQETAAAAAHWCPPVPAAAAHPFMHAGLGMGGSEDCGHRNSEGAGSTGALSHSMSGGHGDMAAAAAHNALDKASQRLSKAAKLMHKLPPAASSSGAATGGVHAGAPPRLSSSSLSCVGPPPPASHLHLNLPGGSISTGKLIQYTPRTSYSNMGPVGASDMPTGALLPRYSLNGPAASGMGAMGGMPMLGGPGGPPAVLSLPSLSAPSRDASKPGGTGGVVVAAGGAGQAVGDRLAAGDGGKAGAVAAFALQEGPSLPSLPSRKLASSGRVVGKQPQEAALAAGMADMRLNRGVPC